MTKKIHSVVAILLLAAAAIAQNTNPNERPRAKVGILPTGILDAITDVAAVDVGQTIIIRGDDVRYIKPDDGFS